MTDEELLEWLRTWHLRECHLAKARIEELLKKNEELERKLEEAMDALDEAIYLLDPDEEDIAKGAGLYRIVTTRKELKG